MRGKHQKKSYHLEVEVQVVQKHSHNLAGKILQGEKKTKM